MNDSCVYPPQTVHVLYLQRVAHQDVALALLNIQYAEIRSPVVERVLIGGENAMAYSTRMFSNNCMVT